MIRHGLCWRTSGVLRLFFLLPLAALSSLIPIPSRAAEDGERTVLFIAGNPSHGYGSHEHYAGCMLLAETIQRADIGVETKVVRGWPQDASLLDWADSIVVYADGGGGHPVIPHRDALSELMAQGKGFVCLHYAVEVPKGPIGDDFLNWLGGYFETHWSVNPHWEADFQMLPDHPVTRGVQPFRANDEWYFHMRFRPNMEGVTPILQAVPPEHTMQRPDGPHSGNSTVRREVAEGRPQTVAWTFERPGGGRSFGFTGGHFHWNWGRPDILRLVANAIVWTAEAEVPAEGMPVMAPSIDQLEDNQDFDPPPNYDPVRTAEEFDLSAWPLGRQRAPEADGPDESKRLFASPVVTSRTPGHQVEIDVPIGDTRDLFLIVGDAGDGFSCDWADWLDPVLVGPEGELSLLSLEWKSARTQWGQVRKNANAEGQPLSVNGRAASQGIGTHAPSVIHFEIPEGYERFRAIGALDTGGTQQQGGQATSVQFFVYADAAPRASAISGADNPARAAENAVSGLDVPEDLEATLVASEPDLRSLTNLDIDDRGRIWVIEVMNYRGHDGRRPEGDRILILEDHDQDGVADVGKVFYQGRDIDSAMGICVLDNEVIVSAAPYVWRFIDDDGDDVADRKIAMFTDTGMPQHDHSNHSFVFGPDGKLYWNFGNTGQAVRDAEGNVVVDIHGREIIDNGDPFFGGMIFRCDLDGSNMEVLAHNFRNNYETAVDSFGTLWQSDNDDDGNRGVRINFVMEHGNYGYLDQTDRSSWNQPRIGMEEEIPERHWHQNDPGVVPNLLLTGGGSPTGIAVYEGRLLPERFWGEMIHCDAGPNVVRAYPVETSGAGYTATIEPILTGERDNWFRPADVGVAPDGSLFVTDWYDPGVGGHRQDDLDRGRVFRVAPPGQAYVIPEFDYSTPEGAAEALRNPNQAARYKAHQALQAMGPEAEQALVALWNDDDPRIRARALWLLGKMEGRGTQYLRQAISDDDENIRITGLRLAKQLDVPIERVVARLVEDPSAAVRREAAIALRFSEASEMPELWAALAAHHDGQDRWYLEALGIGSDLRAEECFVAWSERGGDDWNTPAGRDIVWRTRAPAAAAKVAQILADPSMSLKETERYFRAMEFHPREVRNQALETLLTSLSTSQGEEEGDQVRRDTIIVRAVERMEGFDWRSHEVASGAVHRHIQRAAGSPEYLRLVRHFQPAGAEDSVLRFALENADRSEGVEALAMVMRSDQGRALILGALGGETSAESTARLLGLIGDQASIDALEPMLTDVDQPFAVRAAAVRSLATHNLGSRTLLRLAQADRLPADVRLLAGGLLSRSHDERIRERAAEALPLPTQPDLAPIVPIDQLAAMRGDVDRGRELFRTKGTCANCHIVGGQGKQVGPDLSEIGDKLSREAMFVSILDPSAGISHNYENHLCLLVTGQVITGILVNETADSVTLRTAEAIDRQISKEEIEELKKTETSIMPEDLHHTVDQQGLIDIVEYMMTLKKQD